jgi:alpha-beta hydrolase superfamily lysophospholipase
MKHATPAPPELGTRDGLSFALFLPAGEPEVGAVILHGAGSAKESHFDFARGCREEGMAALAFDARGTGAPRDASGRGRSTMPAR